MHKKVLALFCLIINAQAMSSQCLQEASNQDLLNEISYRMGRSSFHRPINQVSVSYMCHSGELKINIIDEVQGTENVISATKFSYNNDCVTLMDLIKKKVGPKITKTTIVAFCNGSVLSRLMFGEQFGAKLLATTTFDHPYYCNNEATTINQQ